MLCTLSESRPGLIGTGAKMLRVPSHPTWNEFDCESRYMLYEILTVVNVADA